MNPTKHILVIRFSDIGDAAIAVPVLRCVLQQNKNIKITVATKAFLKPVFETVKGVDVVTAHIRGKHKGFKGLLKFYSEIKENNYTEIADLHGSLRSTVIKSLFKLKNVSSKTIDKGRAEKRNLVAGKEFKPLKTTIERYAAVFRALGCQVDLSKDIVPKNPDLPSKIYDLLGRDSKKWVGIAPFAFFDTKMYPIDLMEQVIEYLSKTNIFKIILFGGPKDESELERLSTAYPNTVFTFKKITFEEELQLIAHLDLMLSMDSGNGHLAAMYGVKVITLWGVTHPYAGFYPYKQPKEYALLSDKEKYPLIPTSIYGNKAPEDYKEVMRTILPQHIINKIEEVLKP
ncbi:ADP-heptose:LPS heptosyltransferase [Galbibacter orientalis DSM 19592]|uniref:ADP-heptose:LPS heptosyltransferase n=1 Tax=Galbibacter orientalis DSM 19592 TaxID=926559 RepID=I3C404_9FLAO|nr:glycosyltransferase family 9 protein [Galbibacter orientalis]EIJ38347.1 ADP-heptose:LPS heptosyltransferase [Galbibacter orientalis DSM 19592]